MKLLVQPSKQERSLATQRRILRATEQLLRAEPFDAISVRRIVKEARTSIGSFYARFADKDALLPVLYSNYEERLSKKISEFRANVAASDSLEELADLTADHFVARYGLTPNLSRAMFEFATRDPESARGRRHSDQRLAQYDFLISALAPHVSAGRADEARRVAELGIYFLTVACRNRLFYPHYPQTRKLKMSKNELRTELARMLTSYVRA